MLVIRDLFAGCALSACAMMPLTVARAQQFPPPETSMAPAIRLPDAITGQTTPQAELQAFADYREVMAPLVVDGVAAKIRRDFSSKKLSLDEARLQQIANDARVLCAEKGIWLLQNMKGMVPNQQLQAIGQEIADSYQPLPEAENAKLKIKFKTVWEAVNLRSGTAKLEKLESNIVPPSPAAVEQLIQEVLFNLDESGTPAEPGWQKRIDNAREHALSLYTRDPHLQRPDGCPESGPLSQRSPHASPQAQLSCV